MLILDADSYRKWLTVEALRYVYAPKCCPKQKDKGKCLKCTQQSDCDKDFEFKRPVQRLQAIANMGLIISQERDIFPLQLRIKSKMDFITGLDKCFGKG